MKQEKKVAPREKIDSLPGFRKIDIESIRDNPFKIMEGDWFLLTAGSRENYNTMTCGWGAWGILWSQPAVFVFVRPTRYTYEFMNRNEYFTVCFFDKKFKCALQYCGSHSGREVDKAKETGLIPLSTSRGAVFFKQARMVMECRKIYFQDIDPRNFLEPDIDRNYPSKDYHRLYVGRVEAAWIK